MRTCYVNPTPKAPWRLLAGMSLLALAPFACMQTQLQSQSGDVTDPSAGTHPTPSAKEEPQHADDAVYTCPMHPEIQSPTPGKCPICGMPLELRAPKTEASHAPSSETQAAP
jgi:uncharacterized paraquat-inducible protein A